MKLAVHLLIHGRVQGVGYRAWLARLASDHRLSGYVRNLHTGEVEAVLAGPQALVRVVADACRQGPPGARVDDIVESAVPAPGPGFGVLPDA